jgi:PAS domain S-box-containing protein
MEDHNLTREELLEALAKSQSQVNILQKALLEDSSQASVGLYKEIVEGQTDMITRWLPDTRITYVNQAYCKYFGQSADEFLGKPFLPNLPEATQLIVKDTIGRLTSGEAKTFVTEEKSLDAEGNLHWVQWTYGVLCDETGELLELQSVGRDITDLQEIRIALEENETRFRTLVDAVPDMLFRFDVEGHFADYKGAEGGTIVPPEVFLGNHYSKVLPPHVASLTKEALEKGAVEKETQTFDYQLPNGEGGLDTFEARIVVNETGEAVGLIRDITERKQIEAAREMGLRQTQSLYEMSTKMSMASGLDEILTAVTESITPVDLHRAYLLNIKMDESDKLETVRIIANWGAEGEEKLFPVDTVFPAQLHDAFEMFLTREPFLLSDMTTDERLDATTRQILTGNGMRSAVVLSLFDGQKLFGGILMESRDVFDFSGREQQTLGLISTQLSSIVQNELLLQTTNERAQALATVADVATAVTGSQDPQVVLKQVVDLTKERFAFYHVHVYQLNDAGDMLELVSGAGEIGDQMVAEKRTIPFDAKQSLVAQAARGRKGVIVNDVTAEPNFLPHPLLPDTKAEMAVPMIASDEVLGVLDVQADKAYRFTQDDIDVLTTLASQVSAALQTASQYDGVRQSEALVRTIIDSTPDWIFVKDRDHRYVIANQGYADSLHIPVDEIIGKNDIEVGFSEELVLGNPEKGNRGFWAEDIQVFETNEPLFIERDIVQVDGKERIHATLKTPLTDASGKVTGVLAFGRDVTEREDLLQETRAQAEQEALINSISQKIQATTSVESALQVAIRELGDSLGADKTSIRLGVDAGQRRRKI